VKRALLLVFAGVAALTAASKQSALDRYVAKPDPTYKYELASTKQSGASTVHVIDMTSQTWRSAAEVDHPVWKHWVTIIRPAEVKFDTAMLFITGGSIGRPAPDNPDSMLKTFAEQSNSVVVELRMIPNEPLKFADETKTRTEDGIIAYTWDKFLKGGDETWPLRLPMTKAAVRAMDTVQEFLGKQPEPLTIRSFVVSGASKRGWTTWATAAVDKRVAGIIPLVIDVLNVQKSMEHHKKAFGFWSPAIQDYIDMGLEENMKRPRYKDLMDIEDPYSYIDRFTMPKLVINATGDQYWQPDSWKFYFPDLKGEKNLRYVPNADHSMRGADVPETVLAWYVAFLQNKPRPVVTWSVSKDNVLQVKTTGKPVEAKLWQATSAEGRDFRLAKIGRAWTSTAVEPVKPGVYEVKLQAPATGYTASMVEFTYDMGTGKPLKITTGVRVTPDTTPF
jgi:PhoPQ-activated pathogenicity-related protein